MILAARATARSFIARLSTRDGEGSVRLGGPEAAAICCCCCCASVSRETLTGAQRRSRRPHLFPSANRPVFAERRGVSSSGHENSWVPVAGLKGIRRWSYYIHVLRRLVLYGTDTSFGVVRFINEFGTQQESRTETTTRVYLLSVVASPSSQRCHRLNHQRAAMRDACLSVRSKGLVMWEIMH